MGDSAGETHTEGEGDTHTETHTETRGTRGGSPGHRRGGRGRKTSTERERERHGERGGEERRRGVTRLGGGSGYPRCTPSRQGCTLYQENPRAQTHTRIFAHTMYIQSCVCPGARLRVTAHGADSAGRGAASASVAAGVVCCLRCVRCVCCAAASQWPMRVT